MQKLQPLRRDDVRVTAGGGLSAAPLRAFKVLEVGWRYEPRPEAWRLLPDLLESIGRTAFLHIEAKCGQCGESFLHEYGRPNRYCSDRCERESRLGRARDWAREQYEPRKREPKAARCANCGAAFKALRADARFCSVRCRVAAHRA